MNGRTLAYSRLLSLAKYVLQITIFFSHNTIALIDRLSHCLVHLSGIGKELCYLIGYLMIIRPLLPRASMIQSQESSAIAPVYCTSAHNMPGEEEMKWKGRRAFTACASLIKQPPPVCINGLRSRKAPSRKNI